MLVEYDPYRYQNIYKEMGRKPEDVTETEITKKQLLAHGLTKAELPYLEGNIDYRTAPHLFYVLQEIDYENFMKTKFNIFDLIKKLIGRNSSFKTRVPA